MIDIGNKLTIIESIKEVTSETEYWEQHKIYKKKLRRITKNILKLMSDPEGFIKDFETTLREMLSYGILNSEQIEKIRFDIYTDINSNANLRSKIHGKLEKIKSKFRK